MSKIRFKKWILNALRLRRRQVLRPLRHRIRHKALWSFDRDSVARGAALGMFFGILTPIAQILFAILGAILLRANVVVAALTTLISNPFTIPPIYFWSYRLGVFLTGQADPGAEAEVLADIEEATESALEVTGWFPALLEWVASIGPPLAVGVVTTALAAALAVFVLVHAIWALWNALAASRRKD
jgi:uncharacterized protein